MRNPVNQWIAALTVALVSLAGCDRGGTTRWATTENTNVAIDWDKVNEAYQLAEGPADFERRVNEIYEGDEVISISVHDRDKNVQLVTGFFDKDKSGTPSEGEKIFTIQREVTGEGAAQYATQGYGPYYGYHSPMMSLVSGMVMGSMISSALRPGYVPIYTQPYSTPVARASELHGQRGSYRAANPSRFAKPKMSGSGRPWGGTSRPGGTRFGGGRFGIRRGKGRKPVRLTA